MSPLAALAWIAVGVGLMVLVKLTSLPRQLWSWRFHWQLYQALRMKFGVDGLLQMAQAPAGLPPSDDVLQPAVLAGANPPRDASLPVLNPTTVPGAAPALLHPPRSLATSLRQLAADTPSDDYAFPLGWYLSPVTRQPALASAAFVRDVNIVFAIGKQNVGKDNVVLNIFLALALRYGTHEVQFGIIDGKGMDWDDWATKAHTWGFASESDDIPALMERITAERRRRKPILKAAHCKKWDTYHELSAQWERKGIPFEPLPLLVVYVSELSSLEMALKACKSPGIPSVDAWLNDELTKGRAFGIRYIVATQKVTGMDTLWRGQVDLVVAGKLEASHQDQPNTGLATTRIREAGGVPPSQLPEPRGGEMGGIFTLISDGSAITARATWLDDTQVAHWLAQLPDHETLPVADTTHDPNDQTYAELEQLLLHSAIPGLAAVERQPEAAAVAAALEPLKPEWEALVPHLLQIGLEQFDGRWPIKRVQPLAKAQGLNIGYNAMVDIIKPVLEARGLIALVDGQWIVSEQGKALVAALVAGTAA